MGYRWRGATYTLNPGTVHERVFDRKIDVLSVKAGDRLLAVTPGGGGWGSPYLRPAEDVAKDAELGLVRTQEAQEFYGVVLDTQGEIDITATKKLRDEAALGEPRAALFDRGARLRNIVAQGRLTLTVNDN